jgi:hypothetical protein
MSRAMVVDQRYRLQADDLHGATFHVVIQGITFQGLEDLAPVLHFAGAPAKHLVLDEDLRRELIAMTQSSLFDDWIGRTVELRPVRQDGDVRIRLTAAGRPGILDAHWLRLRNWRRQQMRAYGQILLLIAALILILAVVSFVENSQRLLQTVLDYLR